MTAAADFSQSGAPVRGSSLRSKWKRTAALAAVLLLFPAAARSAAPPPLPGSEDCVVCHEPGPPLARRAADAPPRFDAAGLHASPHARVACTDCHADLKGKDLPHDPKLKPVQCGSCHVREQQQFVESLHGQAAARGEKLAPSCKDCHGRHDVLPRADLRSPTNTVNVPGLCGRCHHEGSPVQLTYHIPQDSILQNYSESIHGEGLFKKGLLTTAVCTSCHTAHHVLPHTDARSSIARRNIVATCTQCHVRIEQVHRQVVNGVMWEREPHRIPACVDCHQPHKARRVYYSQGMADRDCQLCHGKRELKAKDGRGMFVDVAEIQRSRHQRVACAQCHSQVEANHARSPVGTAARPVDCSVCHAGVVDVYRASAHGKLAGQGSPDAPSCRDCHGTHGVLGHLDTRSPTYARNIPNLCGTCHRAGQKAAVRIPMKNVVESYVESIHGRGLLEAGLTVTATCVDCHTTHGELPPNDPNSSVSPAHVDETCARCHRGIYEVFRTSIHSPAMTRTKAPLPTCATCHSAHTIRRADVDQFRLTVMQNCGQCHQDLAKSYFETYHGKVSRLGYQKTAKCSDCHGAHDIRPNWDPRSHLSRHNIVKTCQRCHPGSNRRFAGFLTHATHHEPHKYPALFFAFWAMTGLLVGTFGFFGLHTLAWLPRSHAYARTLRAGHTEDTGLHVRRFPKLYRNLHLMVITSFIALALTGMTLKFSYAPWASVLARMLGGFEAAGFIHRVAALVTFAYFVLHVRDLVRRRARSKRSWMAFIGGESGMLPTKRDLAEFWASMKWFVGRGPRPEYGRWTYWEKFDYFAVFWGVAVIGSTGLVLWFPTIFTRFLPGIFINIATIIHSDEALLAVGFIFTVHFFNTHFRPEKFPMDTVIFTGTVPLEEFKKDRPREYQQLTESGELEDLLERGPDARTVRAWRIFGFVALSLGILLILLILYAAIFSYR